MAGDDGAGASGRDQDARLEPVKAWGPILVGIAVAVVSLFGSIFVMNSTIASTEATARADRDLEMARAMIDRRVGPYREYLDGGGELLKSFEDYAETLDTVQAATNGEPADQVLSLHRDTLLEQLGESERLYEEMPRLVNGVILFSTPDVFAEIQAATASQRDAAVALAAYTDAVVTQSGAAPTARDELTSKLQSARDGMNSLESAMAVDLLLLERGFAPDLDDFGEIDPQGTNVPLGTSPLVSVPVTTA